jgi:Carboxypeptidase regulatory-like domain/TonB dependent receptor
MILLLSSRERKSMASWPLALIMFLITAPVFAQVIPTGTISGAVKDSTGLPVSKASVTVINVESNFSRTTTTSDSGEYRFPALPVGRYNVKVETPGFKTATEKDLTLDVAQEAVVNFAMQVGGIEQQVVVTAEAARVDTTTSSLGHVVDSKQISELPLNGRNFVDLTLLQTGITQFQGNQPGVNGLFGEFYSSNGAPLRSNMYTLDGAIMGNIQAASASSISGLSLGLDGISEYKVMTNSFSAEYGLVMGSQTTIVTKSGTNQFHGDVFEYLRNSALNARNYFDVLYSLPSTVPGGGRRTAPFQRNQFGGALGGPIIKNKTFFFGTYEGFREVSGNPPNVGVTPTIPAACHTPVIGGVQTVTNSCDSALKPGQTENVTPAIQPILALWPLPNVQPGNQFTYLSIARTHEDYAQGRVDHTISTNDSVFGRYTYDNTNETYPKLYPIFDFGLVERQQYLTLAENHIFSPALLNSARFSYSRSHVLDQTPSASNPATSMLTGPQYSCITGRTICPFNISSIANFSGSTASAINNTQDIFSFGDDLFWTKGKHGIKFGTLINHYNQYANLGVGQKGTVAFASLQSFLTGVYRNYTTYDPSYSSLKDMLFETVGFYAQDDYHIVSRLTLNLGLRYEFGTQPTEKNGRQSYFLAPPYSNTVTIGPMVGNPTYGNVSPRIGFAWDVMGDGKTSLKGGAALLYDLANVGGVFGLAGLATPPYATSYVVTPTSGGPKTLTLPFPIPASTGTLQGTAPTSINHNYQSPHMYDFNLAIERQLPWEMILNVAYAGSRGLNLWQPVSEANPFCPTQNTFVPQGCTGITAVVPGANPVWANASAPRLNPFFSNFSLFGTAGVSWYNALQVNLTKHLSHGLQYQFAYTYAKLLDDTEGISNSDTSGATTNQVENPFSPILDWGPANFDVRHNIHVNVLYHLPNAGEKNFLTKMGNGWWTGSIISFQTGMPFSPTLSSDRQQTGLTGTNGGLERMSYVTSANVGAVTAAAVAAGLTTCPANASGCIPYNPVVYNHKTVITHTIQQWFNPNMFALQPVGTIGDVSRNILTEPGLVNWDFSLNKDTALPFLGEAGRLQFRAEAFNILNHANFGPAQNGGVFSGGVKDTVEQPSFSGIISTSTPGRQIQFSLKVLF